MTLPLPSQHRHTRYQARPWQHPTMAAGLTAAAFAALVLMSPPVAAQTGPAPSTAPAVFNIPAQPLPEALAEFARQSGLQLVYSPDLVKGRQSTGTAGAKDAAVALADLLRGIGLQARQRGSTWTIEPAPAAAGAAETVLPAIRVSARTRETATGPGVRLGMLGNADTMNAPFNITAFTAQTIENAQATTVADIARLDPSVRSTGMAADNSDAFFVRGLAVGDNNIGELAFDGMYGAGPNYRVMTDYAERIEILKGPAAMIYGMSPNGAGGGTINVVPKRAGADLTRVRGDYIGRSQFGGHVDVARRFGEGREFGIRFNGTYQDGDTALDHQTRQAGVGALALDYQGEKLRATIDLIDQREDIDAPSRRLWLGSGVALPEAPDGRRNVTQAWEYSKSAEQSALLRLEYEASERLSLFGGVAVAQSQVDRLFNTPSIVNGAGDITVRPAAATFDVQRDSVEAGLRGRFESGPLQHRVTLQFSRYNDQLARGLVNGQTYTSNIHSPVEQPAQNVALPASVPKVSGTTLGGVALSDTLSAFDERLQLILGLRRQRVETENYAADGNTVTSRYDQDALTPAFGLVVKLRQQVSLYGNYIEGLAKGDTAPATATNAGEVFAPYKTKQHEIGVKIDHGRLMTTLSAFQITRPSGQLTNNVYAVDGEQRNRGLELGANGTPLDGLRLFSGLTWIAAQLTQTNNPATQGKTAVGVPRLQATLNVEWDVPLLAGLTLTGGVLHSGRQYIDQTNSRQLPAWTTLDLGARYRAAVAGKSVVWRGNLRNALDEHHWAGASTWSTLAVGAPRTLQVSATVDF